MTIYEQVSNKLAEIGMTLQQADAHSSDPSYTVVEADGEHYRFQCDSIEHVAEFCGVLPRKRERQGTDWSDSQRVSLVREIAALRGKVEPWDAMNFHEVEVAQLCYLLGREEESLREELNQLISR